MRFYSPFFFFLLTTTTASRFLWPPSPGLEATELQQVKHAGELDEEDSNWENLIEMEKCEDGNEECLKRRVLLYEAHLDYIYTQHHPKP
ncbi:putative phytosulfokines 6 [Zingiber officinale]|uniref:Phytosulfokine n=1 Tax=Zingiber officinale TaxID=94328 RepID=A0A8J5LU93_ZINOF|nr:putative phytosulfokines 6 [Zingiber officinale]KAG6523651.1 hypothetical protein ZIOFF_013516 [Zingiber officinale]